jgi:hypothetical protein
MLGTSTLMKKLFFNLGNIDTAESIMQNKADEDCSRTKKMAPANSWNHLKNIMGIFSLRDLFPSNYFS